jgi:hypothetical protein
MVDIVCVEYVNGLLEKVKTKKIRKKLKTKEGRKEKTKSVMYLYANMLKAYITLTFCSSQMNIQREKPNTGTYTTF